MIQSAALARMVRCVFFATVLAISHTQASSAQGLDVTCKNTTSDGIRLLVGRFLTAGSGNDSSLNVEPILQAEIGASLRSDTRLNVSTWSPFRSSESDKTLGPLIDAVFSQGPQGDAAAQRARSILGSELKARGCDYVIGGEVNAGKLLIITPYLFDVRAGTLEVPFEPVAGVDIALNARELGERLSKALATRDFAKGGIKTNFLVGCFGSSKTAADREQADAISRAITKVVSSEISGDPHFPGVAIRPLGSACNDDAVASPEEQTRTILFTGEIELGKRVSLRPRFRIKELQAAPIVVTLDRIVQLGSLEDFIRLYTNEVRTFAVIFGGPALEDAAIQSFSRPRLVTDLVALTAEFDELLNEARYTEAFGLSYRVISDNPESSTAISLSRFTIGRALLKRSESVLALSQLTKALALQEGLPPITKAQLNETLGNTYAAVGAQPAAIARLEDASAAYDGLSLVPKVATVRKAIAGVRLKTGDFKRAKADLQSVPDLSSDFDALLLLAQVSLWTGELDGRGGALQWVSDALNVRPDAPEARALAAEIYATIGRRAIQEKKPKLAEPAFRSALSYEENPQYRYQAGNAAYRDSAFDRAIDDFRRIISSTPPAPFRWTEAAWLTLLECYILVGNYPEADRQGEQATESAFLKVPDSQLLTAYLRTVARALSDLGQEASIFEKDPIYQQTLAGLPTQRIRMEWNNKRVSTYYEKVLAANPEKLRLLKELTDRLFPAPTKG
jgi:tetratricopeptide (TPR) repeat protein